MIAKLMLRPSEGEIVFASLSDDGQWHCWDGAQTKTLYGAKYMQDFLNSVCNPLIEGGPTQGFFGQRQIDDAVRTFNGVVIDRPLPWVGEGQEVY